MQIEMKSHKTPTQQFIFNFCPMITYYKSIFYPFIFLKCVVIKYSSS